MFKVGDKVKLKRQYTSMFSFKDDILTISEVSCENDDFYVHFQIKNTHYGGYFAWRFELVETASTQSKEQLIITKIKYLDKLYLDRKIKTTEVLF